MDLGALVREVAALQQTTTSAHTIVVDAPERLEGYSDRERVGQLLANLVSNAIKYSPNGSQIRVSVRQAAKEVVASVADQGKGIAPEQRHLLFELSSRIEPSQTVAGSGLGLFICKGIAEAHGGRIWVEENPGGGTRFCFTLRSVGEEELSDGE